MRDGQGTTTGNRAAATGGTGKGVTATATSTALAARLSHGTLRESRCVLVRLQPGQATGKHQKASMGVSIKGGQPA